MYTSKIKTPYRQFRKARLCQGDIFREISISIGGEGTVNFEALLRYAVILTQDCDLEQDHRERLKKSSQNDKYIDTVLICPAYLLEDFSSGTQIEGRKMETFNAKVIEDKLKKNDMLKRYHFLNEDIEHGVPELVLDFKHFFTIPRDILYSQKNTGYITTINEIYRESLSQRFANFLSRIGLPDNSSS